MRSECIWSINTYAVNTYTHTHIYYISQKRDLRTAVKNDDSFVSFFFIGNCSPPSLPFPTGSVQTIHAQNCDQRKAANRKSIAAHAERAERSSVDRTLEKVTLNDRNFDTRISGSVRYLGRRVERLYPRLRVTEELHHRMQGERRETRRDRRVYIFALPFLFSTCSIR